MNRDVAYSMLIDEMNEYRQLAHADLVELIGDETSITRRASDGVDYSIVMWVRWYNTEGGDIAVSGSVAPADWGSRHDRLDESFLVSKPQ